MKVYATQTKFFPICPPPRSIYFDLKCVCVCVIPTVVPAPYGHLFDKCCYIQDDRDHDKYRIPIKLDTPSHPNVVINWPDVLWHTSVKTTRIRRIINKI